MMLVKLMIVKFQTTIRLTIDNADGLTLCGSIWFSFACFRTRSVARLVCRSIATPVHRTPRAHGRIGTWLSQKIDR
jgi:hypothetical protein